MEVTTVFGYVKFAMDALYIHGLPLTDEQRDKMLDFILEALDYMTEDEAVEYFLNNSNTNVKEV